jgi:hypothetical protein
MIQNFFEIVQHAIGREITSNQDAFLYQASAFLYQASAFLYRASAFPM